VNTIDKTKLIEAHQYLYYCKGTPVISDFEYDQLCKKWDIFGGGGSDLESSYGEDVKSIAATLLRKFGPVKYSCYKDET